MRRIVSCATVSSVVLIAGLGSAVMAQDHGVPNHRELGPHVHGAGTLKIAVEGGTVALDFSAPAQDIIGYEHQPSTPEQKQTLAAAKDSLNRPLTLFAFPAAAGCTVKSANVVFNAAAPADADAAAKPVAAGTEESHQHADFDAAYALACTAAAKITAIDFPYFQRFAGAQKLTVSMVSDVGQTEFDVTRATPHHDVQ